MVVIDTNIVSELMRAEPSAEVLDWMDTRMRQGLFVTAVTEAEVRAGIAFLPEGRRRRGLEAADRRIHRTCPHTSHLVAWIPGREEGYNEGIEAAWLVVTQ